MNDETPRLAVTVKEGARLLFLSYYTFRRRIKSGRIRTFRGNRAHLVSMVELKRFVEGDSIAEPSDKQNGG